MKKTLLLLCLVLSLCSCGIGGQGRVSSQAGDTLALRYASQLTLVDYDGYTVATIRNPWDTLKTLHTYVLVPSADELPANLPKGTLVRTPLQRAVVYTAVHTSLVSEMGQRQRIGGVCDLNYIKLPFVHEGVANGSIIDCGNGMAPDLERIIDLGPDALLLSPFDNNGGYGRVEELDIPIIECADYMETSALGRAEWMKFYGMLFGAEQVADEMFAQVEKRYLALRQRASQATSHTSVVLDFKSASVWYMPGGRSTMGQLLADANVDYAFADDKRSGSLALSFETVFDKAGESDVWLIKYNRPQNLTYADLQAEYSGNAEFKAFKNRNCYGCNTNNVNFYEEEPFHPDFLLSDFIQICHPEVQIDGGLRYYTKMNE